MPFSASCPPPSSRISAAVHTGNHNDDARIDALIEPVRKSPQQCATSVAMHDLIQHWVGRDTLQLVADGLAELGAQARVSPFVPVKRVL